MYNILHPSRNASQKIIKICNHLSATEQDADTIQHETFKNLLRKIQFSNEPSVNLIVIVLVMELCYTRCCKRKVDEVIRVE